MKSYYRIICTVIAALLITSCNTSIVEDNSVSHLSSTLDFNLLEERTIELPFDFNVGVNLTIQPYTRNDTDFIMMGDIEGSRLVEVDITNMKFSKAIFLKRVANGRYPVFVNRYLNKDTILVFRGISNEHSLQADTVLYSIDLNGNYNGSYTLLNSPYRLAGMTKEIPQASFYHHFMPMEVASNRLFVNPLPLFGTKKKSTEREIGVHEIGYFDFRENDSIVYKGIPYYRRKDSINVFADEQMRTFLHAIDSSELLISHSNSPNLLRVNVNSGEYITSEETGRLIPDPIPIEGTSKRRRDKNPKSTIFNSVFYDSNKELAFRLGQFGTHIELKPGDLQAFRDSNIWIGAYDKELKLVGQALKPSWFSIHPKLAYFKGKFVGVIPTDNPRKFKVQFTSIEKRELNEDDYNSMITEFNNIRPQQTKGDINLFYKNYNFPENSIIITVSNRSCPYCVNYSIRYFLVNLAQMEREGIYLVVSDRSATQELRSTISSNIIIDEKNVLENLLNQNVDNPALMLWNGEKVTRTMVLPPDEVKLIGSYLDSFKKQLDKQ